MFQSNFQQPAFPNQVRRDRTPINQSAVNSNNPLYQQSSGQVPFSQPAYYPQYTAQENEAKPSSFLGAFSHFPFLPASMSRNAKGICGLLTSLFFLTLIIAALALLPVWLNLASSGSVIPKAANQLQEFSINLRNGIQINDPSMARILEKNETNRTEAETLSLKNALQAFTVQLNEKTIPKLNSSNIDEIYNVVFRHKRGDLVDVSYTIRTKPVTEQDGASVRASLEKKLKEASLYDDIEFDTSDAKVSNDQLDNDSSVSDLIQGDVLNLSGTRNEAPLKESITDVVKSTDYNNKNDPQEPTTTSKYTDESSESDKSIDDDKEKEYRKKKTHRKNHHHKSHHNHKHQHKNYKNEMKDLKNGAILYPRPYETYKDSDRVNSEIYNKDSSYESGKESNGYEYPSDASNYEYSKEGKKYETSTRGTYYGYGKAEQTYETSTKSTFYGSGKVDKSYEASTKGAYYGSGNDDKSYGASTKGAYYGSGKVDKSYEAPNKDTYYVSSNNNGNDYETTTTPNISHKHHSNLIRKIRHLKSLKKRLSRHARSLDRDLEKCEASNEKSEKSRYRRSSKSYPDNQEKNVEYSENYENKNEDTKYSNVNYHKSEHKLVETKKELKDTIKLLCKKIDHIKSQTKKQKSRLEECEKKADKTRGTYYGSGKADQTYETSTNGNYYKSGKEGVNYETTTKSAYYESDKSTYKTDKLYGKNDLKLNKDNLLKKSLPAITTDKPEISKISVDTTELEIATTISATM